MLWWLRGNYSGGSLAHRRVIGCDAAGCSRSIVLHLEYLGVARYPSYYYRSSEHDGDRGETSVETGQEGVGAANKAKNCLHREPSATRILRAEPKAC